MWWRWGRGRGRKCLTLSLPRSSYAHITDAKTMDVLLFKGRQHLEEVKMQYKVKAQLQYFFTPPDHSSKAAIAGSEEQGSNFLQNFYAGTA